MFINQYESESENNNIFNQLIWSRTVRRSCFGDTDSTTPFRRQTVADDGDRAFRRQDISATEQFGDGRFGDGRFEDRWAQFGVTRTTRQRRQAYD